MKMRNNLVEKLNIKQSGGKMNKPKVYLVSVKKWQAMGEFSTMADAIQFMRNQDKDNAEFRIEEIETGISLDGNKEGGES